MSKMTTNHVGLDRVKSQALTEKLNGILADYMVFYQNTRGLHWNIKGEKFFELHAKFEELYNNLLIKVDEVAERILTLGGVPLHTFEDYQRATSIGVLKDVSDGRKGVQAVLNAFEVLLVKQRDVLLLSADAGDEGTNALMSDYVREQEKMVWMYSAYLNQ